MPGSFVLTGDDARKGKRYVGESPSQPPKDTSIGMSPLWRSHFVPRSPSGPSTKATHEIDDQGYHKDQPKSATAKDWATEIEAAAAEQEQEHN